MSTKRGYVPEDEVSFSEDALATLRTASRHICYLIDEGYDLVQAVTFVGNRFSLSERQRFAILRSISSKEQLKCRKAKELPDISGGEVWIDGFNTIITLEVMLSGSPVFEGMDGTVRDLAGLHGTYRIIPETEKAVRMLFDVLKELKVGKVHILLDEPISNSGKLKVLIAEVAESCGVSPDIVLLKEVDKALWEKENVISSDSIILDHCKSWVNIMNICAEKNGIKPVRVW